MSSNVKPFLVGQYTMAEATQLVSELEGTSTPMNVRRLAQFVREVKFKKILGVEVIGEGEKASVIMVFTPEDKKTIGTFRQVISQAIIEHLDVVTNAAEKPTWRNFHFDSKKVKKLVTKYLYLKHVHILRDLLEIEDDHL